MSELHTCTSCGGLGTIGDYYWSDDENVVTDNIEVCPACGGTGLEPDDDDGKSANIRLTSC